MSADPSSDPTASLDALGVRYPVLLLDFGGVCIPHPFEIPELFAAAFGLDLASMAAAAGADPSDPRSDPNWQRQQAGEITERQYWAIRAEQVGRLVTGEPWGLQEFFHRFHNDVESAALVRHDADVVVDAALDAGCRVAILTNDLRHFAGERFVAENPFVAKCDPLIDADLTGFMKPDPRAYQGALAALGNPTPGEVLFVDDQPANVDGGRAAGLSCLFFDTTDARRSWWQVAAALFGDAGADRLLPTS